MIEIGRLRGTFRRVPQRFSSCRWSVGVAVFIASVLAGCGDNPATTDVYGKVTFKGQPVTDGLINFRAATGKLLGGAIQSDGTYQYELPPGEYIVRIESSSPAVIDGQSVAASTKAVGPQVPSKFANYATSGLTATVTAENDEQTIDFDLK